jgi:uncharacterized membrane protein
MAYDLATLLMEWESYGVFDYLLPFLLIFAMVYGLLSSSKIFSTQNKINIIISLVVGMLSLRFGFVEYIGQILPRVGVGLAVMLALIILTAAFIPAKHGTGWYIAYYSIGAIIAVVIIYNTFSELNWFGSFGWWNQYMGVVIAVLATIGVIIAISISGGDSKPSQPEFLVPLRKD